MSGTNYYKLELRNDANTAWVEVPNITGLTFSNTLNGTPTMSCTVYTKDSTVQGLMTSGRVWRIVATGDSSEVVAGRMEPRAQQKSAVANNLPVVWNLDGVGFADNVRRLTYTDTPSLSGTATSVINSLLSGHISAGRVAEGTKDTGPTINVHFREDDILENLYDIASVGDATDQEFYYIDVDHVGASDFTPQVNYFSPTNSRYERTNPHKHTITGTVSNSAGSAAVTGSGTSFTTEINPGDGFFFASETTEHTVDSITDDTNLTLTATVADAHSGVSADVDDSERTVDETTEAINITRHDERNRIRNAVKVRYQGSGSGSGTAETSSPEFEVDTTFSERRETIVFAPWVQNEATADILQDTVLNMFKGTASGLQRIEAELKRGEFSTWGSEFDAILGDNVGVEFADGTQFEGIFRSYTYSQDRETLTVTLGIPEAQMLAEVDRKANLQFRQMRQTDTSATSESVGVGIREVANEIINDSLSNGTITSGADPITAGGSATTWEFDIVDFSGAQGGFFIAFNYSIDAFHDGPANVQVKLVQTDATTTVIVDETMGPVFDGGTMEFDSMFPYEPNGQDGNGEPFDIDKVEVEIINNHSNTDLDMDQANTTVSIFAVPRGSVDLTHTHPL